MSSYLSPDWFLCFQARNIFNLCYKTKTNHSRSFVLDVNHISFHLTSHLFAILWKGSDCVQLSHFLLCPDSAALLTSSDLFLSFLEFTDALWQLDSRTLRCLTSAASDSLRFLFPQSDAGWWISVADPQRSRLQHLLWDGGDQRLAHELRLEGKSEFELKPRAREHKVIQIFPLWSKMCVSEWWAVWRQDKVTECVFPAARVSPEQTV